MKVIDFKYKPQRELNDKYDLLEKQLLDSSSLKEQKNILIKFYSNSSFTRDQLLIRKFSLENRRDIQFKDIVFQYINTYFAILSGLLGAFLSYIMNRNNLLLSLLLSSVSGIITICLYLFISSGIKNEKEKRIQKDIPLQEIFKIELNALNKILSSNKEKINVEDYIV